MRTRFQKVIMTSGRDIVIIVQLQIFLSSAASDMYKDFLIDARIFQPVHAVCTDFFCKTFRDPDQKQLAIMDRMGKDIIGSISPVRYVDPFLS